MHSGTNTESRDGDMPPVSRVHGSGGSPSGEHSPAAPSTPELFLYLPEDLRRDEFGPIVADYGIEAAQIVDGIPPSRSAAGDQPNTTPPGAAGSPPADASPPGDSSSPADAAPSGESPPAQTAPPGESSSPAQAAPPENSSPRPFADFVVLDRRATAAGEYELFSRLGVPVGLDEGGEERERFPLLIDTFPLPREYGEANIADPALLDLPERLKTHPASFERLLVSFGGEDPARLTESALEALASLATVSMNGETGESGKSGAGGSHGATNRSGSRSAAGISDDRFRQDRGWRRITVVEGPLFGRSVHIPEVLERATASAAATDRAEEPGCRVLRAPESLMPLYRSHDLVLTTFGLTAYEAAAAGASVILFHPSGYHRRLAGNAGFAAAERIGKVDESELSRLLSDAETVAEMSAKAAPEGRRSMAGLLAGLEPPALRSCPVCGSGSDGAALLREEKRSFFRCPSCGLIYQIDFSQRGNRYGEEYFFEEYRAQYGKSYLEDAAHIRALSRPRLRIIDDLLPRGAGEEALLLDVGCAYGPFLQEAAIRGYRVAGMDISASAAEYVREELGFPAFALDFSSDPLPDAAAAPVSPAAGLASPAEDMASPEKTKLSPPADVGGESFDVLSMWFVIEHFARLDEVLRRVAYLLKPGGIFCFSTPNERGVSGRFAFRNFLRRSPKDHHTIWSPDSAERVLRRYGFRIEKMRSTGHHPERAPFVPAGGPIFHIAMGLSKMLHMGDSFEIYARKVGGES